jgi:hypothetical protein
LVENIITGVRFTHLFIFLLGHINSSGKLDSSTYNLGKEKISRLIIGSGEKKC